MFFTIALIGGVAFWGYGKFPPNLQRKIQLVLMGLIAIASSLACLALLFIVIHFARDLFSGKAMLYVAVIGLSNVAFAYIFWRQFYRILKKT